MRYFQYSRSFVSIRQRLLQAMATFPLLGLAGLTMSCDSSTAADDSHFGVERVVVPAYDRSSKMGMMGRSEVVVPAGDGTVVVAGVGSGGGVVNAAYTAKVDAAGTVLWSHMLESPDQKKLEWNRYPKYQCGVAMADGSIILAGQRVEDYKNKNSIDRGLLTHLDAAGKVLSEQLIVPKKEKPMWRGGVDFLDCISCGDQVALLAYVHNVVQGITDQNHSGIQEDFYMFLLLDQTGAIKHEALIDLPPKHSWKTLGGGKLIYLKDEGFVVAAQDAAGETTLFKLDMAGKVTAQKKFKGAPPMVRSSGQDAIVQFAFFDNGCPTLRTYDKDLKEVSTVQYQKWPADEFFPSSVHRTPEGYFFAASANHGHPFVAYMKDAASKIEMVPIGDKGDNTPSVYVRAAAPGKKPGQFVVAPDVKSRHIVFVQAPVPASSPAVPAPAPTR